MNKIDERWVKLRNWLEVERLSLSKSTEVCECAEQVVLCVLHKMDEIENMNGKCKEVDYGQVPNCS